MIWQSLKRAIWANFNFSKLYDKRNELFALGRVEDNLDLPLDHLYWYADNTETFGGLPTTELSFVRCWYGDYGFQASQGFNYHTANERQRKRQSRKWLRRNNDWNNKARIGLKFAAGFEVVGEPLAKIGDAPATTWRNQTHHGIQSVILRLKGTDELYFRYSYTLPLGRFNPLRWFGYRFKNKMRGVENRYLYKNRLW